MTSELIEYILRVEGDKIHRNDTEDDITSPGGIYRIKHPTASIWGYIDSVANSIGITKPSSEWTKIEIDMVNNAIEYIVIESYISAFYDTYLKGAHIDKFNGLLSITIFNLYTNSINGTWKSVQQSIIDMINSGVLKLSLKEVSTVDGSYGAKTEHALLTVLKMDYMVQHYFKELIISNMKTYYAKLVAGNPDKYLVYLSGWMNRMDRLK